MKPPILDRSRPATSVCDFTLDEVKAFLREKLGARQVQEAYLFGSVAQGTCNPWSDIDVVIVKETDLPFPERPREHEDLFGLGVPVDILVYTREEFEQLLNSGSGFWKEFDKQKIRIL